LSPLRKAFLHKKSALTLKMRDKPLILTFIGADSYL
jgi:hypothetical protein